MGVATPGTLGYSISVPVVARHIKGRKRIKNRTMKRFFFILFVVANRFGNKSAEASCLGEHEVAVSGKKEFISGRFYISPSLTNLLLKRNPFLGLGCDMLPLVKMPQQRNHQELLMKYIFIENRVLLWLILALHLCLPGHKLCWADYGRSLSHQYP